MITKDARGKATKQSVDYTDRAMNPNERCGLCRFFIFGSPPPSGCQKVKGPISSAGWCQLFKRK